MKIEGLFSKILRERVTSNLDRRSGDGRLWWLGEEREERPAGNSDGRGGLAMNGGEKVTGERENKAYGHGVPNRRHRGREGSAANSPRPRRRPEDADRAAVAMAGGVEFFGTCE